MPAAIDAVIQDSVRRPEVRQIVTFLFQPGRVSDALAIFAQRLLPMFQRNIAPLVAARKIVILRGESRLSVR